MNLYLITQDEETGWDTYDAAVVCASDEQAARQIHPLEVSFAPWDSSSWCSSPDKVKVVLLGIAHPNTKEGVVLASFNAG